MKKIYKRGFTLAEVLITLVIIGVIAAITIPSLIAKYHDQQLTSQFKKAFSTMSNAINKTNVIDFSGQAACYYGIDGLSSDHSDCTSFFNQLSKNLNIQKTCKGNAKADGCVPTYSSYPTSSGCSGYSESRINETDYVYILSDGQILIEYKNSNGTNGALFLLDINGFKGPNKYGYDLFSFGLNKNQKKSLHLSANSCYFPDAGGRSTEEMIKHAFAGQE